MYYIYPIEITDALILSGTTIAEDPTSAWVSATYNVGDERHVTSTHRVYRCSLAGASTVSPQLDPTRWTDMRPTNRWAPFDIYTSTAATATTDITYQIQATFCDSLALYGLQGTAATVTILDSAGGSVIFTETKPLEDFPVGWYYYLFGARKQIKNVVFTGLPIRPAAAITVTIVGGGSNTRKLGMFSLGTSRSLAGAEAFTGTQWGSSAEPVTYSYINTAEDGTTTITRRHKATNLRFNVKLRREFADEAVQALQDVLDVPVAWYATTEPGFRGLSTFGIASSAPVSYDDFGFASISGTVKGIV